MNDFFTKLGIEEFSERVADKVIERGVEKIADSVTKRILPVLKQNMGASPKAAHDPILTRKEAAKKLRVSEPTLRKLYTERSLPVYGIGTRTMRFKESEVIAFLDSLS